MIKHMRDRIDVENCVIVSPDAGGAKRYDSIYLDLESRLC